MEVLARYLLKAGDDFSGLDCATYPASGPDYRPRPTQVAPGGWRSDAALAARRWCCPLAEAVLSSKMLIEPERHITYDQQGRLMQVCTHRRGGRSPVEDFRIKVEHRLLPVLGKSSGGPGQRRGAGACGGIGALPEKGLEGS